MKTRTITQAKAETKIVLISKRLLSIALFLIMLFKTALLPISLTLALSSCTEKAHPPCREVLSAIMDAEAGLPAGKVYDMSAAEGDGEFLPERLIATLFGDGNIPSVRQGWLDAALFLPTSSHPCELAVILCDSDSTATDTCRLLLRRLDIVRAAKESTSASDSDCSSLLNNASVTVIGNYVILLISSDPQNALKTAQKAIN